jgi:hypothetical protein
MKERQVFRRTEEMSPPTLVGVSSLLVIFSVLCLAVFAMLSLSTVQMDRRLLGNTVNSVRERAEAEVKAQEILGRLRAGEVPEEAVQEKRPLPRALSRRGLTPHMQSLTPSLSLRKFLRMWQIG